MARAAARRGVPSWLFPLVVIAVVLTAYAADAGRAFIKEDATWILTSRVRSLADLGRLYTDTGGFFRPTVALSFAFNHWMFGGQPWGYGWTNLLLAFACAAAILWLSRVLGLRTGAAMLAAALWILNFHGVNMAVLWLSGRTALLLVLFASLAAAAAARHRVVTASVLAFLAMTSKEEGVLLPLVLMAVVWLRPAGDRARTSLIATAAALLVVCALYAGLRLRSDAYTPTSAPAFYTFTTAPAVVGRNLAEYADRALTFCAGVTLLVLAIATRRPVFEPQEKRVIALGSIWFAAGFALTVFLPARSSLYVLFPSVGGALAAASLASAAWRAADERRRRVLALLAVLVPWLFVPIYWERNTRWTELADISRQTVAVLEDRAPAAAPWTVIVLDDLSTRANVAAALGWGLPDTMELVTGTRPRAWFVPPPPDMDPSEQVMAPAAADVLIVLQNNRVTPQSLEGWKPAVAGEIR